MHRPPAVSHTLGPTRWHLGLIVLLAALMALALLLLLVSGADTLVLLTVGVVSLTSVAGALVGWRQSATGQLQWDGQQWMWSGFADAPVRSLRLVLDFQQLLLLKLESQGGQTDWLWLQGPAGAAHWRAVRRAVVALQDFKEVDSIHTGPPATSGRLRTPDSQYLP